MASVQQSSIVFFLLTITLVLASPVFCQSKNETLIERICRNKQVEDFEFCQRTFNFHFICPSAEIHALTKFTIQHTYAVANFVYTNILHLLEQKSDPSTKKDLLTCRDKYGIAISESELATLLFDKNEYRNAFYALRETVLALTECKGDIKIPRHPKSPVIEANKNTRILITMSLASLELLMRTN